MLNGFSFHRFYAMAFKEFIQMRRDRLTFGMMFGIPLMQLIVFGYAINTDPKHLPTVVVYGDAGPVPQAVVQALRTTDYFTFAPAPVSEADAQEMLATGEAQFVVTFPVNFTRDLLRNAHPQILLQADATDPVAVVTRWARSRVLSSRRRRGNCRAHFPPPRPPCSRWIWWCTPCTIPSAVRN